MSAKGKKRTPKNKSKKMLSARSHRKKVEWLPVKYFILEEILKKGSVKTGDLHKSVNVQLAGLKERKVNKEKFIELLKEVHEQVPDLQLINGQFIDSSKIAAALLKNLRKDQDLSKCLEEIVNSTNDASLQILKLLWRFTATEQGDIYCKLKDLEKNPHEKRNLINKVCELLQKKEIHNVMLSTGVTMFELARQIIKRHDELGIKSIISSNMLINWEFLLRKTPLAQLPLGMPPGKMLFQHETASFGQERELTIDELNGDILQDVQASVLSFTSLSFDEGFKIGLGHRADINEKLIYLRPPNSCHLVLITIDWAKILDAPGTIVKDAQGNRGYQLFDFSNDREYIIITNRPEDVSSEINKKRVYDLKRWEEEGKITVIDTDEKLQEYIENTKAKSLV